MKYLAIGTQTFHPEIGKSEEFRARTTHTGARTHARRL